MSLHLKFSSLVRHFVTLKCLTFLSWDRALFTDFRLKWIIAFIGFLSCCDAVRHALFASKSNVSSRLCLITRKAPFFEFDRHVSFTKRDQNQGSKKDLFVTRKRLQFVKHGLTSHVDHRKSWRSNWQEEWQEKCIRWSVLVLRGEEGRENNLEQAVRRWSSRCWRTQSLTSSLERIKEEVRQVSEPAKWANSRLSRR